MPATGLTIVPTMSGPGFVSRNLAIRRSADRKSTRLNSSHDQISYAVFCLKKKKIVNIQAYDPNICSFIRSRIRQYRQWFEVCLLLKYLTSVIHHDVFHETVFLLCYMPLSY